MCSSDLVRWWIAAAGRTLASCHHHILAEILQLRATWLEDLATGAHTDAITYIAQFMFMRLARSMVKEVLVEMPKWSTLTSICVPRAIQELKVLRSSFTGT